MRTASWPTSRPITTAASAKYQWVTIPLELRGTVVLTDGSVVDVCIGEGDEPKLVIT